MAPTVPSGTPSKKIDSEPFAGVVAIEVSKTVAGAVTSCTTTFTGFGLGLFTTTSPKTVQKGLTSLLRTANVGEETVGARHARG